MFELHLLNALTGAGCDKNFQDKISFMAVKFLLKLNLFVETEFSKSLYLQIAKHLSWMSQMWNLTLNAAKLNKSKSKHWEWKGHKFVRFLQYILKKTFAGGEATISYSWAKGKCLSGKSKTAFDRSSMIQELKKEVFIRQVPS